MTDLIILRSNSRAFSKELTLNFSGPIFKTHEFGIPAIKPLIPNKTKLNYLKTFSTKIHTEGSTNRPQHYYCKEIAYLHYCRSDKIS